MQFRGKVGGSYKKLLRPPETVPASPSPHELIESQPGRLASVLVMKGDPQAVALKSHNVDAVPFPAGNRAKDGSAAAAISVSTKPASSSSTSPMASNSSRGPGPLEIPKAATSTSGTTPPAIFGTLLASPWSAVEPSAATTTQAKRGQRDMSGAEAGVKPDATPSFFTFESSATLGSAVFTQPQPRFPGQPAPDASTVGAPSLASAAAAVPPAAAPVATWERGAQSTVACVVSRPSAMASDLASSPFVMSRATSSVEAGGPAAVDVVTMRTPPAGLEESAADSASVLNEESAADSVPVSTEASEADGASVSAAASAGDSAPVSIEALAAAARPATNVKPRVKTARQVWEAEMFALRLLRTGKIVPASVIDQVMLRKYIVNHVVCCGARRAPYAGTLSLVKQ